MPSESVTCRISARTRARSGFTLLEIMASVLLIGLAMGSIVAMNAQAIKTLRLSREAGASSQILQERIEAIRIKPWPEISNATSLALLMQTGMASEKELPALNISETITVSVVQQTAAGPAAGTQFFKVTRQGGEVKIETDGDLGPQNTLLFESVLTWTEFQSVHHRTLRTIICRAGLIRSGIFGSGLGRPGFGAFCLSLQ